MRAAFIFTVLCILFATGPIAAEAPKAKFPELNEARKSGLFLAATITEKLAAGDLERFPGIRAWLADYKQFIAGIDFTKPSDAWAAVDVDALLSRNPNYWQMSSEVFPGDPGLMLLHAGLLAGGGDLTRSAQIAHIALQRPGIPKPFLGGLNTLIANMKKVSEKSNATVFAGIKLYDMGEYGSALQKYQDALQLWPQNSFAWYETGLTMMQQERIAAGKKAIGAEIVLIGAEEKYSKEMLQALTNARSHDPLQVRAYLGPEAKIADSGVVIAKKVSPSWEKLLGDAKKPASEELLTELSNALREAQLHEFAVLTRQVLIAKRNRFVAEDHPFLAEMVKGLIPHEEADKALKRLNAEKLEFRQLVKPETAKD